MNSISLAFPIILVVMPGATDPPNIRERRVDVIRPVLTPMPDSQAVWRRLVPSEAKSRDHHPQKIDARRVVRIVLRKKVNMRK